VCLIKHLRNCLDQLQNPENFENIHPQEKIQEKISQKESSEKPAKSVDLIEKRDNKRNKMIMDGFDSIIPKFADETVKVWYTFSNIFGYGKYHQRAQCLLLSYV